MLRFCIVFVAAFVMAAPSIGATWSESMFDSLKKDFGSVPRGPTLQHHFKITNNTKNAVTISSVRVSCGCVTAVALKGYLEPGESTSLQASMDTSRFVGFRAVTVFVQFSSPAFDEARVVVQATTRTDFSISPESLALGQVKPGSEPTASVDLSFFGNRDARITKVRADSNYVVPTVVESRRLDHEVVYTVTVKLRPDTPVGKWFTDVWVETNVFGLAQVRVPLTVEIQPPLVATPPILALGAIKSGVEAGGKVIVRGTAPFKILSIKGAGDGVSVAHDNTSREIHILNVKAIPGKAGKVLRAITVVTDLKSNNEVVVSIDADAIP
ncbi:MAG: DUF1573 domain-containing protein [Planctomycetia bacterium]|nr:DUF1573 domain-containing protein [Planctomycetia bacterium]